MKDFIAIADYSPEELQSLRGMAISPEQGWKFVGSHLLLNQTTLAKNYQNPAWLPEWIRMPACRLFYHCTNVSTFPLVPPTSSTSGISHSSIIVYPPKKLS